MYDMRVKSKVSTENKFALNNYRIMIPLQQTHLK